MKVRIRKKLAFWLVMMMYILVIMTVPAVCTAEEEKDDKNGVSSNTIVLPSGSGSIDGLGESFKPQLNTGSATYSVKISVPPGTNGNQPEIALKYDSNKGFGLPGIGWSFDLVYIARQTDKGLPQYDGTDQFMDSDKEELVCIASGIYRRKNEEAFIRYKNTGDSWLAELKNGNKLYFGQASDSRVSNQSLSDPNDQIYKWLLDKQVDTNGNTIVYEYSAAGSDNQKYLSQVTYGPGPAPWQAFYFIYFLYEQDRPDWRKDYRSRFCIKTTRRLKEIHIGIQGVLPEQCQVGDWNEDSQPDALISRYVLSYDDTNNIHSFLSKITKYGSDYDGLSLPETTFKYSRFDPSISISAQDAVISSSNTPPVVFDNSEVEIIDLNSDGLPDLLKTDYASSIHTAYINQGIQNVDGQEKIVWSDPNQLQHDDGFSSTLDLADKRVHLADMDGNGRTDLVYSTFFDQVSFHPNKGTLGWGPRTYMLVEDTSPPSPFYDISAKTTDLDFDKRIDIVKSTSDGYSAWLNIELGQYDTEIRTPGAVFNNQVLEFSDNTVHLADINGDRLNDVVQVRSNSLVYCASMGRGYFDEAVIIPLPDIVLSSGTNGQVEKAQLKDINGDGLADLVIERATINELWYWINLGRDEFSQWHKITNMPLIFNPQTAVRWADMNGNGTDDLVYGDSSAQERLRIIDIGQLVGGSCHPNLLTSIDNGLGAVTSIDYRSSTSFYVEDELAGNSWQTTLPFPVHVVNSVTNEVARIDDADDIYVSDFSYWSGFYDEVEKEFRGFTRENTLQHGDASAPSFYAESTFHTGEIHECLKGKLKELKIEDSAKLYNIQQNSWDAKKLFTGIDGREVWFPYNSSSKQVVYEGTNNPTTLLTAFKYDDFGNTIAESRYGIIDPNVTDPNDHLTGHDEILITREFILNEPDWICDRPLFEQITDANHVQVSLTEYFYDGLPEGEITKGNLTEQKQWLNTEDRFIPTIRNVYDQWGNIAHITNANGHIQTLEYDPKLRTYPTKETVQLDGYSLNLTVGYNYGLGTITDANDFAGVITTFEYDTLSRLKAINAPGGGRSEFDYDPNCPVSTISTRILEDDQGNTFDSFAFIDGLGRELGTKTEAENNEWTFNNAVSFNQRTLVHKKWLPYFTDNPEYELPNHNDPNHVFFAYDALERVTRTTNPDGSYASAVHRPLEQDQYDEKDNSVDDYLKTPKTLKYDGLERLIQVIERNGLITPYVTKYQWTTLGDLKQITDTQNNVKTIVYDSLRRKISMEDPDRGHMDYDYDDVGNLVWTKDAKVQEVVYTYDFAERLKTENYLDTTGDANTDPCDVIWHYDLPEADIDMGDGTTADSQYTGGRISYVEDLSGAEYFSYDQRGNIQWASKHILDPKLGVLVPYTTDFVYDYMNRVSDLYYPDNDHVRYDYNNASFVESIYGGPTGETIISSISYEPTGQQKQIFFGNGVDTTYTYDNRDRLNTLKTAKGTDQQLINYSYNFDKVSNITSIMDNRPFTSIPKGSARRNTQVFGYDDLYRLTQVRYASKNDVDANYGQIDYSYDAIGNMKSKTSPNIDDDTYVNLGTMIYSGGTSDKVGKISGVPGPHALTGTYLNDPNSANYGYDENGNMTDIDGAVCSWDYQDRLTRYQKDGTVAQYTYDYSGRRITKLVTEDSQTTQTLYPNRAFEIRPNQAPTKFVFNGDSRIARVKGTLDPARDRIQRIWLNQGKNLICLAVDTSQTAEEIFGSDVGIYEFYDPNYIPFDPTHVLSTAVPYWVEVPNARVVAAKGSYNPVMEDVIVPAGQALTGWPRLEPFTPAVHIEGTTRLNAYNSYLNDWWLSDPLSPAFLSNMPDQLPSATSFWSTNNSDVTISAYATAHNDILFYHSDHLSSSNVVTDINGDLVQETASYPFGHPRNDFLADPNDPFRTDYKFTGKEKDKETGLQYFEARYYESATGRFVSVDPLGMIPGGLPLDNSHSLNLYAYALDNPLRYTDPTGLGPPKVGGKFAEKKIELWERAARMITAPEGKSILLREQQVGLALPGGKIEQVATSGGCLAVTALFKDGGGAGVHLAMNKYDPSASGELGDTRTSAEAWEKFLEVTKGQTVKQLLLVTDAFDDWMVGARLGPEPKLPSGSPDPKGRSSGAGVIQVWFQEKFQLKSPGQVTPKGTRKQINTWQALNKGHEDYLKYGQGDE